MLSHPVATVSHPLCMARKLNALTQSVRWPAPLPNRDWSTTLSVNWSVWVIRLNYVLIAEDLSTAVRETA